MHRFTIALSALVIFAAACGGSDSDSNPDSNENDSESTRTYEDLSFLEKSFVDGVTEGGGTEAAGICMLDAFEDAGIDASELADLADEEPSADVLAAIFSCSAELFEGGLFGDDSGFSTADTYGDDPELDALWDDCAAGDDMACDDLWLTAPFGSDYESFGSTCGERESSDQFGGCSTPETYGDDPELDALWDDCAAGDYAACDDLWLTAPFGSDYESFGSTCGERESSGQFGNCSLDDSMIGDADTYGDDPALDALWDGCAAGDYAACDTLWWQSPIGSDYESFGSTCGERESSGQFGNCELEFG